MPSLQSDDSLLRQHIPFIATAFVLTVAALRIFSFANYDVPTALTLIAVVNHVTVLMATLIGVLGAMAPLIFFEPTMRKWLFTVNSGSSHSAGEWVRLIASTPLLILAIMTTSLTFVLTFLIVIGLHFLLRVSFRRVRSRHRGVKRSVWKIVLSEASQAMLVSVLVSFASAVLFTPWLPLEVIAIKDKEQVVTGYVAGSQAEQVLIIDRNRTPIWVPAQDMEKRRVCFEKPSFWSLRLSSLGNSGPVWQCPEQNDEETKVSVFDGENFADTSAR